MIINHKYMMEGNSVENWWTRMSYWC